MRSISAGHRADRDTHPRCELEAQLRDEPRRTQHPQRIVVERILRRGRGIQDARQQCGHAVERIDEFQRAVDADAHGHRVDGEVAPDQIALEGFAEGHLGIARDPVVAVAAERGDLELPARPRRAHRTEGQTAGVPDVVGPPAHDLLHDLGPRIGGEVQVGTQPSQHRIAHAAADQIQLVPPRGEHLAQGIQHVLEAPERDRRRSEQARSPVLQGAIGTGHCYILGLRRNHRDAAYWAPPRPSAPRRSLGGKLGPFHAARLAAVSPADRANSRRRQPRRRGSAGTAAKPRHAHCAGNLRGRPGRRRPGRPAGQAKRGPDRPHRPAGRLLWSLPKGHIEAGETAEQTAVREVAEETGIDGVVVAELGSIDYWFVTEGRRVHKTVHHYLMRAVGGELSDADVEVTQVAWVPLDRTRFPARLRRRAPAGGGREPPDRPDGERQTMTHAGRRRQ